MEQNEPLPVPEDTAPPPDTAHPDAPPEPEASPLAEVEHVIEEVVAEVEHVVDVAVDAVTGVVHEIEHRTFGRPSAEHPMPVTIVKGA